MAKVIEFYVPKNFRKPLKWAPALQCGTIIEFCSPTKKSASPQQVSCPGQVDLASGRGKLRDHLDASRPRR